MKKFIIKSAVFIVFAVLMITYLPILSSANAGSAVIEWDGRTALESGQIYTVSEQVYIFSDTVIPEGAVVRVENGGILSAVRDELKLTVSGELIVLGGGTFEIQRGELNIRTKGKLQVYGSFLQYVDTVMNIYADANLNIYDKGVFKSSGNINLYPESVLHNKGNITLTPKSVTIVTGSVTNDVKAQFVLQGSLSVTTSGSFDNYGELKINKDGFAKNSGIFTLQSGSTYTLRGTFRNALKGVFIDRRDEEPENVKEEETPDQEPKLPVPIEKTTAAILKDEPRVELLGIDVSSWQGNINWARVKAAGVKFAMLRAGHGKTTNRDMFEDSYFKANVEGAIANGIDVGVYFYSTARNVSEAEAEANFLISIIKDYEITYPVVFDIEDELHKKLSKAQITAITEAFCGVIAENGYFPMIYSYRTFLEDKIEQSVLEKYAVWVAEWNTKTVYKNDYYMWQYSSKGKVSGITGDVDLNIAYCDFAEIIRKHGLNNL
ncbi:MAG: glycoside hydrolase family 25 protein [Oscillospiraceae bacterium]|nr:glycoside hydrolase family 25 protein [Oscillospiraceae bacterium]